MTNEANLKNISSTKSVPKKRRGASLDRRKARAGWLFVLPFVIGFVLIYLPILFESVQLSFFRIVTLPGGGYILEPAGLDHYKQALLVDPDFVRTLITGLQELIFNVPAIIIFSLFMAVLLNQKMAGRAVFRAIFFIPVILSTGLMESIEARNIMDDYMDSEEGINTGSGQSTAAEIVSMVDVARVLEYMKIGQGMLEYVTTAVNNIYNIVNRSGVQMLIFLAGLQSISPAIYESCQIDGATGWETFWKITFPMISPMILVNAIYTIIDSFTTDSNSVMKFIKAAYERSGNGRELSSAMSWMYFLIVMVIIAAVAGIMSAYVFYQRRD